MARSARSRAGAPDRLERVTRPSERLSLHSELRELARPRRLVTRELYPFNAFYGHADVLRAYAGIESHASLKAAIEHGPTLFPNAEDPDLMSRLPRYFCAAPQRARFVEEHARHDVAAVAIGPPVLYARALAAEPPEALDGPTRRLIFFDAHSSDYLTARYDVDATISRLTAYRDDFEELVVCLYWRDILLGRAEPYLQAGFRCVTAGHVFDNRFLFRLVRILTSASVVFTDRLGSHLLYALALDKPVWLDFCSVEYDLAADAPHGELRAQEGELVERASALFAPRVDEIRPEQRAFAEEFAGLACFRAPGELAQLIAEAEEAFRQTPLRRRFELQAAALARRGRSAMPW